MGPCWYKLQGMQVLLHPVHSGHIPARSHQDSEDSAWHKDLHLSNVQIKESCLLRIV